MKNFVLLIIGVLVLIPGAAEAEHLKWTFEGPGALDRDWEVSTWSTGGDPGTGEGARSHSAANVQVRDGVLDLKLSASVPGQVPVCAEVTNRHKPFLYGSFRARLRTSPVPGAVVGWFLYAADTGEDGDPQLNEIDVELLTRTPETVHYTLHHVNYNVDQAEVPPGFDPSQGFHEYRFDWFSDRVVYYLDGVLRSTLTRRVPDKPMDLLLNHWSGNISGWGGPAPDRDAHLEVASVEYLSFDDPDFS